MSFFTLVFRNLVRHRTRSLLTVLGIGIGDDTVQSAYSRAQIVERPDELARAMIDGVRSALRKSIAITGGDTWWAHQSLLYDDPTPRSA